GGGERWHPRKVHRFERFCREHRDHSGYSCGLSGVDLLDSGVGMWRAGEIAVEHAGQLEIVDEITFALDEADVFNALSLAAHALQGFGALRGGGDLVVHTAASWNGRPLTFAAHYV